MIFFWGGVSTFVLSYYFLLIFSLVGIPSTEEEKKKGPYSDIRGAPLREYFASHYLKNAFLVTFPLYVQAF